MPPNYISTVSSYNLSCQALLGGTPVQNHTIAAETSVSHPESVNPGESFHIIVSSADIDVPLTQQGIALLGMVDFAFRLSIPTNVTVDSVSYLPGINTGAGTPSVTNQGTYVQLNVPGPLTPGTVVTLPSIDLELHANGPSGTPIVLTPLGTSFADWNYSFQVNVAGVGAVLDHCYVAPTPTLASVNVN